MFPQSSQMFLQMGSGLCECIMGTHDPCRGEISTKNAQNVLFLAKIAQTWAKNSCFWPMLVQLSWEMRVLEISIQNKLQKCFSRSKLSQNQFFVAIRNFWTRRNFYMGTQHGQKSGFLYIFRCEIKLHGKLPWTRGMRFRNLFATLSAFFFGFSDHSCSPACCFGLKKRT